MIYPQNFEQKIGFDQIRQLLKTKCLSTLGEERVESMDFSDSYDEIDRRLEQVTEFVRIIQEEDDFPSQYFFDVRASFYGMNVDIHIEEVPHAFSIIVFSSIFLSAMAFIVFRRIKWF